MRYRITHLTDYLFSSPVVLEPHLMRFRPRSDGAQVVTGHRLEIEPPVAGLTDHLDAEGNAVCRAWFTGETERMQVLAVSEVEARRTNPFDYLLTDENTRLPVNYRPEIEPLLSAARQRPQLPAASDFSRTLAQEISESVGHQLSPFLLQLSLHIQQRWTIFHRVGGPPWSPQETFQRKTGACRDVAWMFVDICRAAGLAARFVSGYQASPDIDGGQELHAWAEVYVPGAGWRGYDPTQGLAVADQHIAVAASVDPTGTYPIAGTFRGTGATSTMTTHVDVTTLETADAGQDRI